MSRSNYDTILWLEKHHGRKIVGKTTLPPQLLGHLRRGFEHMDEDGNGLLEFSEIVSALRSVLQQGQKDAALQRRRQKAQKLPAIRDLRQPERFAPLQPQSPLEEVDAILSKFSAMDADGSGAIDFDEFLAVMTSDMRYQQAFRLAEEKEAEDRYRAFICFFYTFCRQRVTEQIEDESAPATERFARFHELFSVPLASSLRILPSGGPSSEPESTVRLREDRRKTARRARAAARALGIRPESEHRYNPC